MSSRPAAALLAALAVGALWIIAEPAGVALAQDEVTGLDRYAQQLKLTFQYLRGGLWTMVWLGPVIMAALVGRFSRNLPLTGVAATATMGLFIFGAGGSFVWFALMLIPATATGLAMYLTLGR